MPTDQATEDAGELEAARVIAAPFLPGPITDVAEIGDGNLNMVFRVRAGEHSAIVKKAPPYLRVAGTGWPLTQDRIRIEADAMRIHAKLAPGRVVTLLGTDPRHSALVMEDLHDHVVWRQALIDGVHLAGVPGQIGDYCARTLLGTSDLLMSPVERKAMAPRFVNAELCGITEELVFTAPYVHADSNRYDDAAEELAASLRADVPMRRAAAQLLFEFRTRREALIHGDLHTGSIMVAPGCSRVIDLEFAFFGPMAYDTGNVVANLAFASLAHQERGNRPFAARLDDYIVEFWQALYERTRQLWPRRQPWNEIFVARLLEDTARYTATELVRRIVGLAHVADIDSLDDAARPRAQRRCIAAARSLALGPAVRSIRDLWTRATTEETGS